LDNNELRELFDLLKASVRVLKSSFHPHGFNVGMNIGKTGGQEKTISISILSRDGRGIPILCRSWGKRGLFLNI